MSDHIRVWRTGRKVGRTIYAQEGEDASDDDHLIGVMDTPMLANEAVVAHNERRTRILAQVKAYD